MCSRTESRYDRSHDVQGLGYCAGIHHCRFVGNGSVKSLGREKSAGICGRELMEGTVFPPVNVSGGPGVPLSFRRKLCVHRFHVIACCVMGWEVMLAPPVVDFGGSKVVFNPFKDFAKLVASAM